MKITDKKKFKCTYITLRDVKAIIIIIYIDFEQDLSVSYPLQKITQEYANKIIFTLLCFETVFIKMFLEL